MSSERRNLLPDPIVGTIELPTWLVNIKDEPAVRRMLFIRQLGLKAYVDYPGAIHTRYSHSLGTMYLSGKLTDLLIQNMNDQGHKILSDNLKINKENIMAAGFLHDIAHGPFSHSVDFAMNCLTGKSHQEFAEDVISNYLPEDLGNWVDKKQVIKMISGEHDYPFISQIIDGPIDVDKLDYLLRDAYHVGLRYSFDLDYFLGSHTILGNEDNLKTCKLGLKNTHQAVVTTELFLVVWKSMYDLVYHVQNSRIAEKMLEKAILVHKDDGKIKDIFSNTIEFLKLDDDKLLTLLSDIGEYGSDIVTRIKRNKVYKMAFQSELNQNYFEMSPEFIESLKEVNKVCDNLSRKINEKYDKEDYQYICDIITSKSPKEIQIDNFDEDTGEYVTLRNKSNIVGAIQALRSLRIYANPSLDDIPDKSLILEDMIELIEEERND